MASELRVNTLKDASGNNSIATSFVAGGSAKAWCPLVYSSGTPTAADSLNVASFTDTQTGDAYINYTSSTASTNCSCGGSNTSSSSELGVLNKTDTTARARTITRNNSNSLVDSNRNFQLHGDLA